MASDWNNKITTYNATDSSSSLEERTRIPVVPLNVSTNDDDTKDEIYKQIKAIADTRELVLDYNRGNAYIKNGSDVYSLKDVVASSVITEYGDQIKVTIGGAEVNISEILVDLENERVLATPAIFDNRSEWVGDDNNKINLSVDNKTTELVFDTSTNSYKIQIKGYDPVNPTLLTNTIPYINDEGNLVWKNVDDLSLSGFDSAQNNTVPVKSGDNLIWSKVTNNGSDVQFVDIDSLDTVVDDSVTNQVITHEVVYADIVEGHNIVCMGAATINASVILEQIADLKQQLNLETINHKKDIFSLSCQVKTVSFGHDNLIVEDFREDSTIIGDMIDYINNQYSLNYKSETGNCELSYTLALPVISGIFSYCVYFDGDTDTILTINKKSTTDSNILESYSINSGNLYNISFDKDQLIELKITKQNSELNINNIAISYKFVERG